MPLDGGNPRRVRCNAYILANASKYQKRRHPKVPFHNTRTTQLFLFIVKKYLLTIENLCHYGAIVAKKNYFVGKYKWQDEQDRR